VRTEKIAVLRATVRPVAVGTAAASGSARAAAGAVFSHDTATGCYGPWWPPPSLGPLG